MSEDPDGPIEIELTAHAPKRSRGRRAEERTDAPAPAQQTATRSEPADAHTRSENPAGWLGTERSRLLMSVSAAAVVALLTGWMLGRSGGDSVADGDEASSAPTTAVESTESPDDEPDPGFEEAEELPGADVDPDELFPPPTTAPPLDDEPAATTEPPPTTEPESIEIAFDTRALGRDLTLITVDGQRRILEIDLSTGAVAQRGSELPSIGEWVFGGDDWVGVATQDSARLFIDRDDGSRNSIEGVPWWSLAVDATSDALWIADQQFTPSIASYSEADLDGAPTGRMIELPIDSWSALYDDGAFLATVMGDVYRIGPDGHTVETSGQIVAVSTTTLVVSDCDEELRCGFRVVDRASGEERWVPPGPGAADRQFTSLDVYFGGPRTNTSLSPDGRWLPVVASDEFTQETGLLDLQTGHFVVFDGVSTDGFGSAIAWAPDSRAMILIQGRVPWMHDTDTGETFRLSDDRLTWSGAVLRPNAAG